ncbi:MAG: glycosyltransferase family 4 protein [Magnetococcales bacterium]|nr:glycosyltransferase family 4 protein [Magnetococcales bacterium]
MSPVPATTDTPDTPATTGIPGNPDPLGVLLVHHTRLPKITGGIDTMLVTLMVELKKSKIPTALFAPASWEQATLARDDYRGTPLYRRRLRMPLDRDRPLRGLLGWLREFPDILKGLHRVIAREKIQVIHLQTIQSYQLYFRLLHLLGGPPYLVTLHGTDVLRFGGKNPLQARLLKWILKGAARVVGVSPATAQAAREHFPFLNQVDTIPNGIAIHPTPQPLDLALPEKFFILVCDIEPVKGPDIAAKAWVKLRKSHPDVHLMVVGGHHFYPELTQRVQGILNQGGCGERVHFTGTLKREEIFYLAQKSLGQIAPSRREGMPYIFLEAGVASLPLVASAIPPFTELIQHGSNGLLAQVEDPDALAACVRQIIEEPDHAREMGQALRQKVVQQFSAHHMMTKYVTLYRDIVDRKKSPSND